MPAKDSSYARTQALRRLAEPDGVLDTYAIAALYGVDVKTAGRWFNSGRIAGAFKTPGKHWRARAVEVRKQLQEAGGVS